VTRDKNFPMSEPIADAAWTWLSALTRERVGAEVLRVEPLAGGLGLRRFYRIALAGPPHRAIARVEAPEDPAGRPAGATPEPPLEPIRALLERSGLPVPRRYAGDAAHGVEWLEDLGDVSLFEAARAAAPGEREALVRRVVDLVPRLQRVRDDGSGVAAFARRLDAALFAYKGELFAEWSLPLALGRAPRASEREVVTRAFARIADACARAPYALAHRDLQSQNVLLHEGRLVLIDLQGAFLAPPEYDLVCLLRDSYLAHDDAFARGELERVRPLLAGAPAREDAALRFDLLTLSRKGKDHARFVYALRARGDGRYAAWLAPTARMLRAAAARAGAALPALAPFAELVARLPEEATCAR
jgi:hypothetical protein